MSATVAPVTEAAVETDEAARDEAALDARIASAAPAADGVNQARDAQAARILADGSLPAGLRECLARVVTASGEAAADGTLHVPVDAALLAVSEALPEILSANRAGMMRVAHPAGEPFFNGDPGELSDAAAEEIARGQLARSGLLRGQKVRTAE